MAANPLTVLRENPTLEGLERSELVEQLDVARGLKNAWLKHQILVNNRIDLLATEVLKYELQPFHFKMMQWQFLHPDNLQMAFRGAGKSTTCTVTKCIHLLLKNPNLRIVIVSKTIGNAQAFLRQIKGHFENNALLAEIFGTQYDPRKCTKWDETEINVLPRSSNASESSITCVGVNGTIVGKHYDVEFSDDLVDEENARTQHMRDKTWAWYHNTLDPCIEPPDAKVLHRGERHRLGTRYHYDDQYGRWMDPEKGSLREHTQVIPALDEEGRSPWPEKFPPEWFAKKRETSGLIIFSAQYLCNTEAMKGEIFQYDDCQVIEDSQIPDNLRKFIGVDLAISEDEAADHFALVVIGVDMADNFYVLDFFDGQKRFNDQTKIIRQFFEKYDPIRIVIEENAYQKSQIQNLLDQDTALKGVLRGQKTELDKVVRAWKLTPIFEGKRVFFRKNMSLVVEQLVLFPAFRYKDLFDAFDMAVTAAKLKKKRKNRTNEPTLI